MQPRIIAIVDDDESVRQALSSLVRSSGYETQLYASAEAFLVENLGGVHLACLIVDIHMPGASGLELQQHLFELNRLVPVIFITGYPEEHLRERAFRQGAVALLRKPFSETVLLDAIQSVVDGSRM